VDLNAAMKFESRYTVDPSGCWLWTGALNRDGYGTMHVGPKTMLAHRVAYLLYVSSLGESVGVLHLCDRPACVNPAHLFPGTHTDNMRDMAAKGRGVRPRRPASKLTLNQAVTIRFRHAQGGVTGRALAKEYGVCGATVSHIVNGKTW
jgi:hypothetical protein